MHLHAIAATALLGLVATSKITEHDRLAVKGLANVAKDVAAHGYPKPGTCTLDTARVRKEWYVPHIDIENSTELQEVATHHAREAELYQCHQMHSQQACSDPICSRIWGQKSIR
jgi:hypothetical protein